MKKNILLVTFVALFAISGTALGQRRTGPGGMGQGTLRFHLDTSVLEHRYDLRAERSDHLHLFWADAPYLGFGFGGAVIDNLFLGARTTLGFRDNDPDEANPGDNYQVQFGFMPYIEYMFWPTDWLSPFVTAQLGVEGWHGPQSSNWNFKTGAGGGLHFFLIPQFSMDLTGYLNYHGGHHRVEKPRAKRTPNHDLSTTVMFGLSGWL